MRKAALIIGSVLIAAIIALLVIRQSYKDSPDYNYVTAKLDVYNKDAKIIHVGHRIPSPKDNEIDMVAAKYGFKNIYVGYDTTREIMSGINNYNQVMEAYLKLRNGIDWREAYLKEVDSLYKTGPEKKAD